MLVFSDIFRQEGRSVLLLSHFGLIITQLEKIVDQVSNVLWSKLLSKHLTVSDHDGVLDIAVKFRERWNLPNVIGCINGKHIRINP